MALFAITVPSLPGKTQEWRRFVDELRGTRLANFKASRRQGFGARERTFYQTTPMGDFVIVTLEGENPAAAMAKFGAGTDAFTRWFVSRSKRHPWLGPGRASRPVRCPSWSSTAGPDSDLCRILD